MKAAPQAEVWARAVVPVALQAAPAVARLPIAEGEVAVLDDGEGFASALAEVLSAMGHRARVAAKAEDVRGELAALVLTERPSAAGDAGWDAADEQALAQAFALTRTLAAKLRASAGKGGALLACVSRRDGAFGKAGESGGGLPNALAGLVKSAAREWPEVRCRALDVSVAWSLAEAARAAAAELASEGPVEVGVGPAGRLTLAEAPLPPEEVEARLQPGDLVVVTGGARGVTAACALELARSTGAALLLLGRSPAPEAEAAWLAGAADEAAIKRALLEHATGARPSPRELGEQARAILAQREVRATLAALQAMGAKALYRAVDVRDEKALAAVLAEARAAHGPVRGLVHGAGVLRDRRIEDKTDDDFAQVLSTKVEGLRHLLAALSGDELKLLALFASVSGRYGRKGQADYAAANQALAGIAEREARRRPHCRVVAFDWGPWEGGMVTPALRKEFEREGVGLIPLEAGAKLLVEEARKAAGGPAERLVGAGPAPASEAPWRLVEALRLGVDTHPFLADHVLAGKPVLPLAVSMEWLAAAARRAAPGAALRALEDVRVLRGVALESERAELGIWAAPAEPVPDGARVALELRAPNGAVHVRAVAHLGAALPEAPAPAAAPGELKPYAPGLERAYRELLFHGARLRPISAVEGLSRQGMALSLQSAGAPAELGLPGERWATDPLLLDGVFQALILWCRAELGAPSLPSRLGAYRAFRERLPSGRVQARVRVREADAGSVVSDVELLDEAGRLAARLEGYVCTVSPNLERAFAAGSAGAQARDEGGLS